ncbi:hypothetical protein MJO28_008363 [Puccinia striiformis f. sp. tritici]|uniref:Uncharacterized protein n=1 Tax=Puccinia striiformis f. sp. tritici TaxID=168172 RepID=A0ACC0ECI8_9BASI|nr:hypothetical protein MJO28_008363 [Puccinia striiformis f. sp. tritici]
MRLKTSGLRLKINHQLSSDTAKVYDGPPMEHTNKDLQVLRRGLQQTFALSTRSGLAELMPSIFHHKWKKLMNNCLPFYEIGAIHLAQLFY